MDKLRRELGFWGSSYELTPENIAKFNRITRTDLFRDFFIDISWVLNAVTLTNNIEGIALTLEQTRLIHRGKQGPKLVEKANLVSDFVSSYLHVAETLDHSLDVDYVMNLHYLLLRSSNKSIAGEIKQVDNFVIPGYYFTPYEEAFDALSSLILWYEERSLLFGEMSNIEVIEIIAQLKQDFINIHPFPDGNGRLSRLLVQKELARFGFPPILFNESKRKRYHSIMGIGYNMGVGRAANPYLVGYIAREIEAVIARGGFNYLK